MTYRFMPAAEAELIAAADWYNSQESGLGSAFVAQVDSAIERILALPLGWSRIARDYRRCRTYVYPYAVIYRIEGDVIIIVSIFHQHRKPGSWRANLRV